MEVAPPPNQSQVVGSTLDANGNAAFPYIFNVQIYGQKGAGGNAGSVASDAVDYFTNGALTGTASADPALATWYTKGSNQSAQAISIRPSFQG